ncbi:MAG: TIGR03943 family protein [Kurthia sp.]|nr:TIGR03943 family protein [Candidatus Kurthia equi]
MIRAFILMGFTYFFYHLQASGDIAKYINMKYAYISKIGLVIFVILTIVQITNIALDRDNKKEEDCDCGHDHRHEKDFKWYTKIVFYAVMIFPIFSALFLPIQSLDSTIVKSKGFSFQAIEQDSENDDLIRTQYLRPDTSIYFNADGYEKVMEQELARFTKMDPLKLTDDNFLMAMETIYNYPGLFEGKKVEYTGFMYNEDDLLANQGFVLRFGVIHCIADAGVYGMMIELPKDTGKIKNDQWLRVSGTLSTMYYQPFKSTIPYLKVDHVTKQSEPDEPYAYRGYDNPNETPQD